MSKGFDNEDGKLKVTVHTDEVKKLLKDYKKIKKYMRSPLYEVKKIDGNEEIVTELLKELEES